MSFHRFLSEISGGTWLIAESSIPQVREIAKTIFAGGFMNEAKPEAYFIIGKETSSPKGEVILKNKVAVVDFVGIMTKYSGPCNIGAQDIASEIISLQNLQDINGFIFLMDGPGGNADAYPVFEQIKSQVTKPVVALIDNACSLHYWIASTFADNIMLNNTLTAEVGNIGVQVTFDKNAKDLVFVRPPESSDKNAEVIAAISGDTKPLEEKLSPLAKAFMSSVKASRPQVKDEALHGKTFSGKQAIEVGLADSIGNMQKAYNLVMTLSELKKNNK